MATREGNMSLDDSCLEHPCTHKEPLADYGGAEAASFVIKDSGVLRRNAVYDPSFVIKDSGERHQFASGMVRDVNKGKTQWHRLFDGPMAERYSVHLTKGAVKYPDVAPFRPNWMLAAGEEELARAKESTVRHLAQWLRGDTDEDHAAAIWFGVNLTEYIISKMPRNGAAPR